MSREWFLGTVQLASKVGRQFSGSLILEFLGGAVMLVGVVAMPIAAMLVAAMPVAAILAARSKRRSKLNYGDAIAAFVSFAGTKLFCLGCVPQNVAYCGAQGSRAVSMDDHHRRDTVHNRLAEKGV